MGLQEDFDAAATKARETQGVSNENKLKIYKLYKQGTVGPLDTTTNKRPGMFDPTGRMKYDAWLALGDMSKEQAMKDYIALVDSL